MTDDLKLLLLVAAPVFLLTSIGFAIAWVRARERAMRAELDARGAREAVGSGTLAGIQQAVDSVAIEVERVGEAQRFLTRQIGERAANPSGPPK